MSFTTFPTLHRLPLKSYAESNFNQSPMDVFQPVAKLRSSTWRSYINFVLQLEPNGHSADLLTQLFLTLVYTIAVLTTSAINSKHTDKLIPSNL